MKRILLIAVLCLVGNLPAKAATINIDLYPGGVFQGSGIQVNNGFGMYGIGYGYLTTFFSASPGDTVNFGTVSFAPFITGDQYGDVSLVTGNVSPLYIPFPNNGSMPTIPLSFVFTCNAIRNSGCQPLINSELAAYGHSENNLSFVIPDGDYGIQLVFNYPNFEYLAPAVPEPSTWAMLLLGFAGIVFMARRRQRITALLNCM